MSMDGRTIYESSNGEVSVKVLQVNESGDPSGSGTPPSTILDGATTVTTAGTPVALGASTAIKSVLIQADPSNTGLIYVGNASSQSIELSASDIYTIDIDNLSKVYIDSSVNGEGVAYNATA